MLQKGSLYESSLYASIILLTGMGVVSLPSYLDEAPVSPVNAYTASMYLAFLGWAFHQLHALHARKSPQRTSSRPTLVKEHVVISERARHNDEQAWIESLSRIERITLRLLVALGGVVSRAEQNQETRILIEAKEKPEAA